MKMILVAAMFVSPYALADSSHDSTTTGGSFTNTNSYLNNYNNTIRNSVRNTNTNTNTANGIGLGVGVGLGGSSTASNTATNAGNSVSLNESSRPVNSAFAPTVFPTAPCMGSSSLGGGAAVFSFSGGTSWTSEECMILETARGFDQAGYKDDGLNIRCQGKWAKTAPSCIALAEKEKAKQTVVVK